MSEQTTAAASDTGTWHALVIGIDGYTRFESGLRGAVLDATAMRDLLVDQLHVPAGNVRLVVAPVCRTPDLTAAPAANAAAIRQAFEDMKGAVGPNDHLVFYYAGHGVRVSSPIKEGASVWTFGLAASDFALGATDRMITSLEITRFFDDLAGRDVQVTAFFDCCHGGGSLRGSDPKQVARGIAGERVGPEPAAWASLPRAAEAVEGANASVRASGWVQPRRPVKGWAKWAVLAACCADQTAYEAYDPTNTARGVFTKALLRALKEVTTPARARDLRWMDLHDRVCALMPRDRTGQLPTLEGIPESLVFGGQFRAFDPGFNVTIQPRQKGDVPRLLLDGGIIQGLEVGAVVSIYPPHTADFEATTPTVERATIDTAELVSSTVHLPRGHEVASGSRARLIERGPNARPMSVRLTGLPDDVKKAVGDHLDAKAVRLVDVDAASFDVEVVPWEGLVPALDAFATQPPQPSWVGTSERWALVSASATRTQVTDDDVIAYLPSLAESGSAENFGGALAAGLAHWARYLDVLGRTHSDPFLDPFLDVTLCKGPEAAKTDSEIYEPILRSAAREYEVTPADFVWIELHVKMGVPGGLFVGVLWCSDDGDIQHIWPATTDSRLGTTNGVEGLLEGQTRYVGAPGEGRWCLGFPVRRGQKSSRYTLEIIAYASTSGARDKVNLASLVDARTVQEVLCQALAAGSRGGGQKDPLPVQVWVTRDLVVRSRV
jgi:hypothetical protein